MKRHASKAADLFQPFLQFIHQNQIALHGFNRLQRMCVEEARQAAGVFVDLRVVFHGAGTQRIEAIVHAVVEFAESRVVADNVHFGEFGQGKLRA